MRGLEGRGNYSERGRRKKNKESCYLLECFIGGLGAVVSCACCIVGVCQHHPPLAVRDYELWRS